MQIFLDCDGVLADFDTPATKLLGGKPREVEARLGQDYTRAALYNGTDFFRQLPLLHDARVLVDGVRELFQVEPVILTAAPPGDWARPQKLAWRDEHFPGVEMLVCRARDKCLHGKPGDILVDDWPKYRHLWEEMGGIFILHTSAEQTLKELVKIVSSPVTQ